MRVSKILKNLHTFLLSSPLIRHLTGQLKTRFDGFPPWATSKIWPNFLFLSSYIPLLITDRISSRFSGSPYEMHELLTDMTFLERGLK